MIIIKQDNHICIARIEILYILVLCGLYKTLSFNEGEVSEPITGNERSHVEVRAVFIKCGTVNENVLTESERTRFEREELFKHSELKDCIKKLALSLKITSEANISGDEYIPIEHVFDGANKKRVRLLDPYILRLRRDIPFQAYKLRRLELCKVKLPQYALSTNSKTIRTLLPLQEIDDKLIIHIIKGQNRKTVCGVLTNSDTNTLNKQSEESKSRNKRDVAYLSEKYSKSATRYIQKPPGISNTEFVLRRLKNCERKHSNCAVNNNSLNKRYKRSELNIVVENASKGHIYRFPNTEKDIEVDDNINYVTAKPKQNKKQETNQSKHQTLKHSLKKIHRQIGKTKVSHLEANLHDNAFNEEPNSSSFIKDAGELDAENTKLIANKSDRASQIYLLRETDYAMYEIGTPELWYTVDVQLFEKMSTPEGKTVWNDLTKGEVASVSSLAPGWTGQDMTVRYRTSKWMPRSEFSLPTTRLYLLVPINGQQSEPFKENSTNSKAFSQANIEDVVAGSVIVPEEDIIGLNDEDAFTPYDNNSEQASSPNTSRSTVQKHRRVMVRAARVIIKGSEGPLTITFQGDEKFLTMLHRRPHHAQIDLEARANENELVRVGDLGRISIAVADSSRRTRTILNLQVGNTGLAAARFRVIAKDLDPVLAELIKDADLSAGPILIPPRHTKSLRLELPVEIPVNVVHCSVSLLNDQDQSIAVRDVAIKKGDRCFCVWHCECVCLSDDLKLLCRDMDEIRQKAAGLPTRVKPRHSRSICYSDNVPLNLITVFTGVLASLLFLGVLKAIFGLMCRCVAMYGLDFLLQTPRLLDHYYESSLRFRNVEYDKEGWPVHPDTKKRTIHIISPAMEFLLNIVFFVCAAFAVVYELLKSLVTCLSNKLQSPENKKYSYGERRNYDRNPTISNQDLQEMAPRQHRHRDNLRKWMTPQAQELSRELWLKSDAGTTNKFAIMQTLLSEKRPIQTEFNETPDSCPDSEQDDTKYVLTQMKKSRESLAKSQKNITRRDSFISRATMKKECIDEGNK